MPFAKGQSGNPAGRPPQERALAVLLRAELDKRTVDAAGKRVDGKTLLARQLTDLVVRGETRLPNGDQLTVGAHDWLDAVKFVFGHIDGPARAEVGIDQSGTLKIVIEYVDPTPDPDLDPPPAPRGAAGGEAGAAPLQHCLRGPAVGEDDLRGGTLG